jgi:hypothetical protein
VEGHACDQLQPQPRTSGEVGAELLKRSTLTDGSWRNISITLADGLCGLRHPARFLRLVPHLLLRYGTLRAGCVGTLDDTSELAYAR